MPVIVLSILMVVAMAVTIYGSAFLSLRVTLFGLGITVAFFVDDQYVRKQLYCSYLRHPSHGDNLHVWMGV